LIMVATGRKNSDKQTDEAFRSGIRHSQERKLRARREGDQGVWFGLGMFGIVGWSVAVPALLAIALGIWIDTRFDNQYSWTLMLLVVGVAVGCLNAWFWISREGRNIGTHLRQKGEDDKP
jgi:ATP synthase protein I